MTAIGNRKPVPVGAKFNRWTILGEPNPGKPFPRLILCRCDCGAEKLVQPTAVINGHSKGCFRCAHVRHGASHTPLHEVWHAMAARCRNPKDRFFHRYGGRGITLCSAWQSFAGFLADMGPTYIHGLSIERRENDLGYSPDNCYWATKAQQARNKSNNVWVDTCRGRMVLQDVAQASGTTQGAIKYRLAKGITGAALFAPPANKGQR